MRRGTAARDEGKRPDREAEPNGEEWNGLRFHPSPLLGVIFIASLEIHKPAAAWDSSCKIDFQSNHTEKPGQESDKSGDICDNQDVQNQHQQERNDLFGYPLNGIVPDSRSDQNV